MGLSDASDSAGDLAPLSDDERSCLAEIPGAPRPPRDIASLDWARYGLDVAAVRAGLERPRDGIVFTPPSMAHLLAWRLRVALERAAIVPKRVLDPALGTGSLLLALGAQLGWPANVQLVGVERDAAICAEARRQLPVSVEVRCGDSLGDPEADGLFDAVIGNPPYIFTRNEGIDAIQKKYFYHHYQHQSSQLNTFGIFLERCYELLKKGGVLGFITPNNWLTIDSFSSLRKFILLSTRAVTFINILDRVFTAANVDTAITLFEKNDPTIVNIGEMKSQQELFSVQTRMAT